MTYLSKLIDIDPEMKKKKSLLWLWKDNAKAMQRSHGISNFVYL